MDAGTAVRTIAGAIFWTGFMIFTGPDWWKKPESTLLLGMLVVVPAGLALARQKAEPSHMYRTAQYLQPFAAVIAGASYLISPGVLAGTLAIAWLPAMALPAIDTLQYRRRASWQLDNTLLSAAFVYLLTSAIYLWIERVDPASTPATLIAALHLLFSGFGGSMLGGLSVQALQRNRQTGLLILLRITAPLLILAPLPALWLPGLSPEMQTAAAVIQTVAFFNLSAVMLFAALRIRLKRTARIMLLVSGLAGLEATIAGGVAAAGDLSQAFFFSDSAVAILHSWPFAAGFILCGLAAWAIEESRAPDLAIA